MKVGITYAWYAKTNADLQTGIDPTMGDPSAVTGHTQEVIPQDILGIEEENVNTKKKEDD